MENVKEILFIAFFGMMFCVAVGFLMSGDISLARLQDTVLTDLTRETTVSYETDAHTQNLCSSAEVTAYALDAGVYGAVEIDGDSIDVASTEQDIFNAIKSLSNVDYSKTVSYDANGAVVRVIFKSIDL